MDQQFRPCPLTLCVWLNHEHGGVRGSGTELELTLIRLVSLRGGGTELELTLIKLVDDLAHGCLIQIGRNAQRSLRLCGGHDRRNCGRHRDESRLFRPGRAGSSRQEDYESHSRIWPSTEENAQVAVDPRVGSWIDGRFGNFHGLFVFSDLNEFNSFWLSFRANKRALA
jgi:hypothetical protein